MAYETKRVAIAHIDCGHDAYRISTDRNLDLLKRSLATVGLINVPLLIAAESPSGKSTSYRIVCGFRRIAAAIALNWEHLTANILDKETAPLECACLSISDNISQRKLNLIEESRALRLLGRHLPDESQLARVSAEMGLAENRNYIAKVKPLCDYPQSLQKAILNGTIALAMASQLGEMDVDQGAALVWFFENLQLNLNQQRTFLTLLKEISTLEDTDIQTVLKCAPIQTISNDDSLDRPGRRRQIETHLKKRRFPAISKAEAEFETRRKRLKLGQGVDLIPPPSFEGTSYSLRLSFQNLTQFQACQKVVAGLGDDPEFKAILERKTDLDRL